MRHTHAITVLFTATLAVTGCGGGGSGGGSKVFGEQTEPCAPIVLTNDVDDETKIATGTDCLLREIDAGRPVVWDVLAVTVEGDPIPTRFEYDGDQITITRDSTRDDFGSGGVVVERCDGLRATDFFPEGVGCLSDGGDGFRSDSLPTQ